VIWLSLVLGCTGTPGSEEHATDDSKGDLGPSGFRTAKELAGRGIFLRPIPEGMEGLISERAIRSVLATRFSADFRIHSVHRGLADIPNNHFNWTNELVYVVERTGRGSRCFDFFDATTRDHRLAAC
jgi:hypothetical protein